MEGYGDRSDTGGAGLRATAFCRLRENNQSCAQDDEIAATPYLAEPHPAYRTAGRQMQESLPKLAPWTQSSQRRTTRTMHFP